VLTIGADFKVFTTTYFTTIFRSCYFVIFAVVTTADVLDTYSINSWIFFVSFFNGEGDGFNSNS